MVAMYVYSSKVLTLRAAPRSLSLTSAYVSPTYRVARNKIRQCKSVAVALARMLAIANYGVQAGVVSANRLRWRH